VAAACARLGQKLPTRLDGRHTRVTSPRSPRVAAWGNPPVVMRCGVALPAGYDPHSASTVTVDGVPWFQERQARAVRWTTARRDANVELTVPSSYAAQAGFLVDLSAAVRAALPDPTAG
jgi:hypothetical protein